MTEPGMKYRENRQNKTVVEFYKRKIKMKNWHVCIYRSHVLPIHITRPLVAGGIPVTCYGLNLIFFKHISLFPLWSIHRKWKGEESDLALQFLLSGKKGRGQGEERVVSEVWNVILKILPYNQVSLTIKQTTIDQHTA